MILLGENIDGLIASELLKPLFQQVDLPQTLLQKKL